MNAVQSPPQSDDAQTMLYRTPQEAVASCERLVLNPVQRTFSRLLLDTDGSPRLVAGQAFSLGEFAILHQIVSSYPEYCPFEDLLAAHYGSLTEDHIAECRDQLQEAIDTGTWIEVIGPLRPLISQLHMKVRTLGLELGAVYKTGYLLQAVGPAYRAVLEKSLGDALIRHLLRGFVPSGQVVAYNPTTHILSSLAVEQEQPRLLVEALLTVQEERVLLPVFETAPAYCSDQRLLASFTYGVINEETLARATDDLDQAKHNGQWDYTMRPVRNAMSRARLKVSAMGISIPSILATGYMATYVGPQLYQRHEKGGRRHG